MQVQLSHGWLYVWYARQSPYNTMKKNWKRYKVSMPNHIHINKIYLTESFVIRKHIRIVLDTSNEITWNMCEGHWWIHKALRKDMCVTIKSARNDDSKLAPKHECVNSFARHWLFLASSLNMNNKLLTCSSWARDTVLVHNSLTQQFVSGSTSD